MDLKRTIKKRVTWLFADRNAEYEGLHQSHAEANEQLRKRRSAEMMLGYLREVFPFESVVDVGCGIGTFLDVSRHLGAQRIQGIEGPWLQRELLVIEPEHVVTLDLEKAFDLTERFDLVISLEVAEHLRPEAAEVFVESLVTHGDVVMFSAAIPRQGGTGHLNEQWQSYWANKFNSKDYAVIDLVRSRIWDDPEVMPHFKQNTLLYVRRGSVVEKRFDAIRQGLPLDVVHPFLFEKRLRWAEERR